MRQPLRQRVVVQAREPFSVTLPSGIPLTVAKGDLYWSDDPLVVHREHLFTELTVKSSTWMTAHLDNLTPDTEGLTRKHQ
jgi:hypothetical protein